MSPDTDSIKNTRRVTGPDEASFKLFLSKGIFTIFAHLAPEIRKR